jgi:hypothetical protein
MKEKGVMGVAARLVSTPPRFEKLINMLLGRTIVVQDTEMAVSCLSAASHDCYDDGIVFHTTGADRADNRKPRSHLSSIRAPGPYPRRWTGIQRSSP